MAIVYSEISKSYRGKLMEPHNNTTQGEGEIDEEFVLKLRELGRANRYQEYLDILHPTLKQVVLDESDEPLLYLGEHLDQRIAIDLAELPIELTEEEHDSRLYLRKGIIERLNRVQASLPDNFRLCVRDPLRTEDIVWKLYHAYVAHAIKEQSIDQKTADLYVRNILALPDDPVTPGHMTGGAIDVVLLHADGSRAQMVIDYELIPRKEQMFTDCEGLPEHVVYYRQLLKTHMEQEGFLNYFREYWHYSFGDSYWAVRRRKKIAHYGLAKKHHFPSKA